MKKIFQIFYTPNIDLFATRENRQLAVFCSPRPTEGAWCTDALSANWKGMYAYAFPPQILLHRVLRKVQQEPCTLILVAPLSPTLSWFPVRLELVIDYPRLLPRIPKLLTQEKGRLIHPDPSSLKLAAWKISVIEETRIFQKAQRYITENERPSTRNLYKARQRIYDCWCRERQINSGSAALNEVAECLIFLHEVKSCEASTRNPRPV